VLRGGGPCFYYSYRRTLSTEAGRGFSFVVTGSRKMQRDRYNLATSRSIVNYDDLLPVERVALNLPKIRYFHTTCIWHLPVVISGHTLWYQWCSRPAERPPLPTFDA
jgi:hypothetical protein